MIFIVGIFFTLGFITQAYADELKFDRYKTADGLVQNNVYAIAQDARGFMWFGTQDGLSRYNSVVQVPNVRSPITTMPWTSQ